MVRTYTPPDQNETLCPSCGASIKAPPSPRNRRVQCPKCREVVVIESRGTKKGSDPEPTVPAEDTGGEDRPRLAALEERVAALEAALVRMVAGSVAESTNVAERKLLWVAIAPGRGPEYSAAQAEALVHNLGTVKPQAIAIRIPGDDAVAAERATWFKTIFLRAGWTVRGPDKIAPENASRFLSLAVPELPVAEDAAKTYLALRAAGFEPVPVLDSASAEDPAACALSLTIPLAKPEPPPSSAA